MTPARNQRDVEHRLRDALKQDRARVQFGRISRFGLLEMSRQRLRPSLGESSLRMCPTCNGRGFVRGPESLALSVLRIVEEEAMKDLTGRIVARLPIEVATFLLNEKREGIFDIEKRTDVQIILVPDPSMTLAELPDRASSRDEDHRQDSGREASYELTTDVDAALRPSRYGADRAKSTNRRSRLWLRPLPHLSQPATTAETIGYEGRVARQGSGNGCSANLVSRRLGQLHPSRNRHHGDRDGMAAVATAAERRPRRRRGVPAARRRNSTCREAHATHGSGSW